MQESISEGGVEMPSAVQGKVTAAYESSASCSFMVIKADTGAEILEYQVSMLEFNRPEYLLFMGIKRENGIAHFYYDITSKLPLDFLLKRKKLKRNEFVRLLDHIARPLAECDGYLLKDTCFLLDARYIYIDPESLKVSLAYIPVRSRGDMAETFKSFMADLILHHASIEEAGSDNFLQRILGFVKRDIFNTRDLLGLLEELVYQPQMPQMQREALNIPAAGRNEAAERDEKAAVVKKDLKLPRLPAAVISQVLMAAAILSCKRFFDGMPGNANVTYGAIVLIVLAVDVLLFKRLFFTNPPGKVPKAQKKIPEGEAFAKINESFEASRPLLLPPTGARLPAQGKTELLGNKKPDFPTLRSRNSQEFEEIVIDRADFIIGRLQGQADYVCNNNAIGKMHAMISTRGANLFIRDLNSVNGTFVNGCRIESNKDVEVKDNDCITLANCEYVLINK